MKKLLALALSFIILLAIPLSVSAAEATTPTGIPLSEIGKHIDEIIATYMHEFTPGIAIAVVHDGKTIFSRGYGYADAGRQLPIDPATAVFEFGSVGKLFVWTSVMQLAEQGLLDLDSDIHNYLPEDLVRQFNFSYSFTMRDLLNHSAGFGEFNFNMIQDAEAVVNQTTLREGLLATQPRQIYVPGTAKAYSNFGSALAAYIVGYLSGFDTFADYERINILKPLGMINTRNQPDWFGDSEFMQTKARGHFPNAHGGFNQVFWWYSPIYPAGTIKGTAEDLAQFAIALMPPQHEASPLFSSRDTLDLMLSPSYSNPRVFRGTHHGFLTYDGIYLGIGHSGGTTGFNSNFVIIPSQSFGVITLTNAAGGGRLSEEILDLLIGNSRDTEVPLAENLPDAASVAGTFVSLRRNQGNMMESTDSLLFGTHVQINALDENTITFTRGSEVITYRQTAPYVFRVVSADNYLARNTARNMYKISFITENGQPIKMSTSFVDDFTIQTFNQSTLATLINMALYFISMLFFLIMPIIIFVKFLRRKEKEVHRFSCLSNGLMLCGTLFTINVIILSIQSFTAMQLITTAMVTPHIWINYILLALSFILFVVSLALLKTDRITKKRKAFHFTTAIILAALVLVMQNLNYFVIM